MENALIFASEKEVRFTKLLKFIVPTYLTSLFNTVYTIIDGIFVVPNKVIATATASSKKFDAPIIPAGAAISCDIPNIFETI